MPIIPPAIVLSTGLSRTRRNLRGGWAPASFPSDGSRHRFTSDSKRGLARTRKVNFACSLVGREKKREGPGGGAVTLTSSAGGGGGQKRSKGGAWVFSDLLRGLKRCIISVRSCNARRVLYAAYLPGPELL
jgi:hypothetical protein